MSAGRKKVPPPTWSVRGPTSWIAPETVGRFAASSAFIATTQSASERADRSSARRPGSASIALTRAVGTPDAPAARQGALGTLCPWTQTRLPFEEKPTPYPDQQSDGR